MLFILLLFKIIFPFILRHKSDIINSIKSLICKVRSSGRELRRLRSDNTKEFVGREVEQLFLDAGIVHEKSSAYCPEQNGRAERQNRTITEMITTLLDDAKLPKSM
jgi:transposase InsO family protein